MLNKSPSGAEATLRPRGRRGRGGGATGCSIGARATCADGACGFIGPPVGTAATGRTRGTTDFDRGGGSAPIGRLAGFRLIRKPRS